MVVTKAGDDCHHLAAVPVNTPRLTADVAAPTSVTAKATMALAACSQLAERDLREPPEPDR